MYLCDAHTHTKYSYDGTAAVDKMCTAALENGLDEIVITDHYDANLILPGILPDLDIEADRADAEAIREKYPSLKVSFGIEMGDPCEFPENTERILSQHKFDFVIGSVHNLPSVPDFYYLDYSKLFDSYIDYIYEAYLGEMIKTAGCGCIDTLAHLNYPLRYIYDCGKTYDALKYRDKIAELFKTLIKNDVALEVNTSGLTRKMNSLLPGVEELKLYRELGGKLLTIGSDAHAPQRVGENIKHTHDILRDIGFNSYFVFLERKPFEKEL